MFVESKSGSTRQPVLPAVFKTVISYPRDARGGFDSHVLPPSITQKVPVMALQPHSYSRFGILVEVGRCRLQHRIL
jgi:hypothetical protein